MNRKGFTLVELLAVLVILGIIIGIAIPSINSSMERAKKKQDASNYKVLEASTELYVSDHKNSIVHNLESDDTSCYISIKNLLDENYISKDVGIDANGNELNGVIVVGFSKVNSNLYPISYKYETSFSGIKSCL